MRRGFSVRGGTLPALLATTVLALSLGGCSWWEKNVNKPVKELYDRRLTITSDPPGADVYVDNVYQGKTPVTLTYQVHVGDLFKGFEVMVQKEGYRTLRREVSFRTDNVTFKLLRNRSR